MDRTDHILNQLTTAQKASLCAGADAWHTRAVPEMGVPAVMMTDGPNGIRKQYNDKEAMFNESAPATCFPTACATACSFDRQLLRAVGRAIGEEARKEDVSLVLGPGVNIKRSPLGGRNFEYFSEDPYLSGQMGAAIAEGIQQTGAGACVKHFAANNREYFRMVSNSIVDDRALREIYLPAFETVVKDARPFAVMSAYNRLNAEYCGESPWLLDTLLRGEWGFPGMVVSDWGAVYHRVGGVRAGMDLEMPYSGEEHAERIERSVKKGDLAPEQLDACAGRVLDFVRRCEKRREIPFTCDMDAHHALAKRAAAGSAVLLKNDGILPLSTSRPFALIGEFAKEPRFQGAGSSQINPARLDGAKEEFTRLGAPFAYAQGYGAKQGEPDEAMIRRAVELAKELGRAVIFAGLPAAWEAEGADRRGLGLPECQNELISRVAAVAKTAVVLTCGGVVAMPWLDGVSAVLHCHLGGEAVAAAAAELLLGLQNPSGRLAETYPVSLDDVPCRNFFTDDRHNTEYRESIYVGYRYYDAADKKVAFPFGFGLSYTTFEYSDFRLEKDPAAPSAKIGFTIANTGGRAGAEVAQVYTRGLSQPHKQLFGFEKVFLEAGESRRVEIPLPERAFSYWRDGWKHESCEIFVGRSSRDIVYGETLELPDSAPAPVYEVSPDGHWDAARFYSLFGRIPQMVLPRRPFTINATLVDIRAARLGKLISNAVLRFIEKRFPKMENEPVNLLHLYVSQSPFRALAALSGGAFTYEMAAAVLMMANGNLFLGILRFSRAARAQKKRKKILAKSV